MWTRSSLSIIKHSLLIFLFKIWDIQTEGGEKSDKETSALPDVKSSEKVG